MEADFAVLSKELEQHMQPEKALGLLREAVSRESVTGNEANFASLLEQEMETRQMSPQSSDFQPGRPIVWGERKGSGKGKRLQYVGHTDTVHAKGWKERWSGTAREDPFGAAEVEGAIWGRGVADLKGGICASLAAMDLLDACGVRLVGDVAFAFVGDEESGEPGSGNSAGIRAWTEKVQSGQIAKPDFAIYVEPTKLDVYTSQIGFFIAEVRLTGKSAYFGRPELGVDALKATHAVLSALWEHADELENLPVHDLVGKSSVLVTGISGGGYIAVPGDCEFSIIRTLRPEEDLEAAVAEFEEAIDRASIDPQVEISIEYPAARDHRFGGSPSEISPRHETALLLSDSIKSVEPGKGMIGGAQYWSESTFLIDKVGCPTVYCAPGDISNCHTLEERLEIDEYLEAIRAYALFNARYCGIAAN